MACSVPDAVFCVRRKKYTRNLSIYRKYHNNNNRPHLCNLTAFFQGNRNREQTAMFFDAFNQHCDLTAILATDRFVTVKSKTVQFEPNQTVVLGNRTVCQKIKKRNREDPWYFWIFFFCIHNGLSSTSMPPWKETPLVPPCYYCHRRHTYTVDGFRPDRVCM